MNLQKITRSTVKNSIRLGYILYDCNNFLLGYILL